MDDQVPLRGTICIINPIYSSSTHPLSRLSMCLIDRATETLEIVELTCLAQNADDEGDVLVVDNGSGTMKAGIAAEGHPKARACMPPWCKGLR